MFRSSFDVSVATHITARREGYGRLRIGLDRTGQDRHAAAATDLLGLSSSFRYEILPLSSNPRLVDLCREILQAGYDYDYSQGRSRDWVGVKQHLYTPF